ncbi:MAG TPA: proline--tRNA ligase [Treponemataceae bacterium]|nr:proline--tRNA ligase [Treponemataceae bacterium]HQL04133.1 proline--tRNA ligase [Treponemataceae bacterium]
MKTSQTLIATLREVPAEAVIASHQLMLRAGLLRKLGNGLFAYLPFGLRAFRKVENIIREEMNNIGALEFRPSVVVPGELWRESGRWETMGAGMLRVTNRVDQELVVSPTAEEAFTSLIRDELSSYKQLPITAYQINTKYRDEIRPRYGVMRGREFTMKDAYSFHADQKSLDETYDNFAVAYRKIFKRLGLSVIPVRADAGAMGGTGSEEFMVESAVGDDTLILCPSCGYAANTEKAACEQDIPLNAEGKPQQKTDKPKEAIDTPNVRTIEELSSFLKTNPQTFIKTLIYKVLNSELDLTKAPGCASLKRVTDTGDAAKFYPVSFFAVCIRGDLDVNEAKLASLLKASEVELACDDDVVRITNAPVGFAGPAGLSSVPVIADESVLVMHDAVTGGLAKDVHFIHVEPGRDFTPFMTGDVRTVVAGDKCASCGAEYYSKKGNELGHIFKLGYKYTKAMNVTYLDENGKLQIPTMGCYGIGVDRALASIIEEHHDENGIVWTMSVAPYQAVIVPIKYEGAMKETADALYEEFKKAGIEVLLDDRNERPGVKFKDMDLIGIPVRVVVGDKNLPNVEIKERAKPEPELIPSSKAASHVKTIIDAALADLNS